MTEGDPLLQLDRLQELTNAYCDGLIEDVELRELETLLRASGEARRFFVQAFQAHTELIFAVRTRRATDAVLETVMADLVPEQLAAMAPAGAHRSWLGSPLGLAGIAAALVLLGSAAALSIRLDRGPATSSAARSPSDRRDGNVAWLLNAQDCQWAGTEAEMPGRDMRSGKLLRLRRGLAEIEFEQGARVILQGPAELVLLSGGSARLLHGALTARVPVPARGFTILSPQGKVVDLGTEFGLAVEDGGATTVRVFDGMVAAFPLTAGASPRDPLTINHDQTARLDGRQVAIEPASLRPHPGAVQFVRSMIPSPMIIPRTLSLDFVLPVPGTLMDLNGQGTGLTHRLPGTGTDLSRKDPNLQLDTSAGALLLTTTRSDLNTQDRMPAGEYLGVRLSDLGLARSDDFEISATVPRIPGLDAVGQFGLYVGADSKTSIRGGLISMAKRDRYGLFLVNNSGGIDRDTNEVGLMTTGDNLRLTLRRLGGKYSLLAENLSNGSSNTLTIKHPDFLDQGPDLFAGIFAANTQSDVTRTLTIQELKVTIWSKQPAGKGAEAASPRS